MSEANHAAVDDGGSREKKPYQAPCILSIEVLEAAAGTCGGPPGPPGPGGFGKQVPPCQPNKLGS